MQRPNKPTRKSSASAGGRPNTIGLGQRELGELLDRMDCPTGERAKVNRDFVRWPFRQSSVRVEIFHPGGVSSWITVACRNISRTGMAILHSAYAHTGTKCRVMLSHPVKGEVPVDGWVTRCCHRGGVVHEIGLRFDQQLNVQEFLRSDLFSDWFSMERVTPEQLTGSIVYADESDIDRKIIRHFLRQTRLTLATAGSAAEALRCIDETTSLVLLDFHLPDMPCADLVQKVRDGHPNLPVVILTCDTQAAKAGGLESLHASACLAKPVSQELLLRALAEFLIVQKSGTASQQRSTADKANPALLEGVLAALSQYAEKLEDAVQRSDTSVARTVCLQIAGAAGSVGLRDVALQATKSSEALTRCGKVFEAISPVRSLIAMCRRASAPAPTTRQASSRAA